LRVCTSSSFLLPRWESTRTAHDGTGRLGNQDIVFRHIWRPDCSGEPPAYALFHHLGN
jgi:hypothetical protein